MSNIQIRQCTESDEERWEGFVADQPDSSSYHRWAWKRVFEEVFGWPAIYLIAEEGGEVRGILPLVHQKCWTRSYLSSMPHLKGGGIVARSPEAAQLLYTCAVDVARHTNAEYLELRQLHKHELPLLLRQDKVGAVLRIEADSETRLRCMEKKARNLVRKSLTFGMVAEFGGAQLLGTFYEIYRHNMRDLGSPAYSRQFFSEILNRFPDESYVCVIRLAEKEVAAAFMIGFRETLEVAWASSYRKFLRFKPNMFLYWNILNFAAERGYKLLDFGRSSRTSGTYEFKLQWGAIPNALHWCYWLNQQGTIPEGQQAGMQMASRVWRRLPLPFTNILGPALIKHIPGI